MGYDNRDQLIYGNGSVMTIGDVRALIQQHPNIVGSIVAEVQRRTANRQIVDAHCPVCSKPVTRGVMRYHHAQIGRKIWFEDEPTDSPEPTVMVERGDMLYFQYSDRPHYYVHDECGGLLPEWIGNLIDGLLDDDWWLPDDMPFEDGEGW